MRVVVVVVVLALAACTKANPAVCCVTDEQCAALGAGELRPCEVGQACAADFSCVAAECTTSADCTDAANPVCSLGLCVSNCRIDADCADVAGRPLCADEGVCVGCIDASTCPVEAAICDADTRACRGCDKDSECESGVCLEADAACVQDVDVIFVVFNGTDTGTCSRDAACRTIGYAFTQVSPGRNTIHIDGGSTTLASTLVIDLDIYIDGTNTTVGVLGGSTTLFDVQADAAVTFGRIVISGGVDPAVTGQATSSIRFHDAVLGKRIDTAGTIVIDRSSASSVFCDGGTLSVSDSTVTGTIDTQNCQVTVSRNRFDNGRGLFIGGVLHFENNLAVIPNALSDFMLVSNVAPTSAVRFNTIVNTTSVNSSGVAIACDPTLDVSSNIFAYRSTSPLQNGCQPRFSLFDNVANSTQTQGEGNKVADDATIFLDRDAMDFHLASASAAKESAEASLVIPQDLDGEPRPQPAGSVADMGAFEDP